MRSIITIFAFLLTSNFIYSQDKELQKIEVQKGIGQNFYFEHTLRSGETLYGLSKRFNCTVDEIRNLNLSIDINALALNQIIILPLEIKSLKTSDYSTELSSKTFFTYKVEPKETLYTIAKIYFQKDVNDVMNINGLTSNAISIGEELIIGYFDPTEDPIIDLTEEELVSIQANNHCSVKVRDTNEIAGQTDISTERKSKDSKTEEIAIVQIEESTSNLDIDDNEQSLMDIIDLLDEDFSNEQNDIDVDIQEVAMIEVIEKTIEKGLAFTEQVQLSSNDLFVLHPTAKINSKMILSYPMLKTTATATVISDLPSELYPSNISVVISPSVAIALGAKDDQFRVEMQYIETE